VDAFTTQTIWSSKEKMTSHLFIFFFGVAGVISTAEQFSFFGLDANNDLPPCRQWKKKTQLDHFPMRTVRSAPGSALSV
jgi:hypothetical protein